MQKQAPTAGRLLVMVFFALSCFGLMLFLWLSFGGAVPLKPVGYRVQVVFPEGTQLAEQGDVRVAGVPVGKVVRKEVAPRGRGTLTTIQLDQAYAPLAADAKAMLRAKTLLGETYVELTLGTRGARRLPEGGRLPDGQVRDEVQLDEILGALDPATRGAMRTWQQQLGRALRDRGPALNATLARLPEFEGDATEVLEVLDEEERNVQLLVRESGRVFEAISRRQDRLQGLVRSSDQVFGTTSRRQDELARSILILPTFMRELRRTLRRVDGFAQDAEPAVRALGPALREVRPAVAATRRLAPDLGGLARRLPPLRRSAATGLPALDETVEGLRPLLAATGPLLSELNPVLEWLEYNQHYAISVFNAPSGLSYTVPPENPDESVGRVLRSLAPFGLESIALWPNRLPNSRGNTYLPPLVHSGRRHAREMIQPSWDCANTGRGEFSTTLRDTDDPPGCWTTGWPGRREGPGEFPHIERADYTRP